MTKQPEYQNNWIKEKWEESIDETGTDNYILGPGEKLMLSGAVKDLEVDNGSIVANVYDISRKRYYKVEIDYQESSDNKVNKVIEVIKSNLSFIEEVSKGIISENLLESLKNEDVNLISEYFEEYTYGCKCNDYEPICKHIAAVFYALGELIANNPLKLFDINGIQSETLLKSISQSKNLEVITKYIDNARKNEWLEFKWIEALESSTDDESRLHRGEEYLYSGAVEDLRFKDFNISAKVEGNYERYYKVEIEPVQLSDEQKELVLDSIKNNPDIGQEISSGEVSQKFYDILEEKGVSLIPESFYKYHYKCSCPDDADICKHLAAVFYSIGQEIKQNPLILLKINGFTKDNLVSILHINIDNLNDYIENTLDSKENILKKLTDKANKEDLSYLIIDLATDSREIFNKCVSFLEKRVILTPTEEEDMSTEKFMTIWDDVKWELEKIERDGYDYDWGYEDNDSPIDDQLRDIVDELEKGQASKFSRREFVEEALSYLSTEGFEDAVYQALHAACYDNDDLVYLAQNLENSSSDWVKKYAMFIYHELGDKEKYLKLRSKKLETDSDYYDLITFYENTGETDKAVSLAYEALKKIDGYKTSVRDFLIKHNKNIGNRDEYLKLEFEKATGRLGCSGYLYFKSICTKEEWEYYESQILKHLKEASKRDQMLIFIDREEYSKAIEIFNKETPYAIYHIDYDIAEKLKSRYPQDVVNYYIRTLGDYTTAKDRKAYTDQAKLALRIKEIYLNNLDDSASWRELLTKIKASNKRRPALQEEFSKVISEWKNI